MTLGNISRKVAKRVGSTLLLVLLLSGCAARGENGVSEASSVPTLDALGQKDRSVQIQQQIRDIVPERVVNMEVNDLPEIGERPATLLRCQAGAEVASVGSGEGIPVYYSGTFALGLKSDVHGDDLLMRIDDQIRDFSGWEQAIYTHENASGTHKWFTDDGFMVLIDVTELDRGDGLQLSVNVTSPCFIPENPYKAGDKI
ncbi:hypothetical protein [Gulosibacter bifidus]|uniref:Lipoprotein n=1 Tax=Gulosibacter bifidus TaxID=272239 RepID=A0ABW5RJS3_9MICO|nr:hypothetical protein [Gulosibacter bifidus]